MNLTADPALSDIAHLVQISVAPVFLLSGVGAFLGVLTSRLARIIDRARVLEAELGGLTATAEMRTGEDLRLLSIRARHINRAITLCTTCALLVCVVIAVLFLGAFVQADLSIAVAVAFVAAMGALFVGLLSFLREIFVATRSLRIGPH